MAITHPERYCTDPAHECHFDPVYHFEQTGAPTSNDRQRITTGQLNYVPQERDVMDMFASFTTANPDDETNVFVIQEPVKVGR